MNSTGKTKASQSALANASEATRKLNPHLFTPQPFFGEVTKVKPQKVKRIRQDKPTNKLEQEAFDYLKLGAPLQRFGLLGSPTYLRAQSKRVRLANGLWYKSDVTGMCAERDGGIVRWKEFAIEVKGPHAFRGGFENLKMAATQYPEIRWILMWKDHGQWQFQEVLP